MFHFLHTIHQHRRESQKHWNPFALLLNHPLTPPDVLEEMLKKTKSAIVMITHEPSIARQADKIYRIVDGELYKDGLGGEHSGG